MPALTAEQRALRESVAGLLARRPADDRALWRRLCAEIGVAGLAIPQRYGGAGAGPVETHVAAEELGRALTASPLLGSAVLAGQAVLGSGDPAACQRLLPPIADGSSVAALAWTGPGGHWDPGAVACTASRGPAGWTVSGEAHYVLDGADADVLLAAAAAPDGIIGLFQLDPAHPAVTRTPVITMDLTRPLATVTLAGAPGRRIGGRAGLTRARDLACIALSGEQAGAAAEALRLTVRHAKVREQFGRPLGSFQALQHRMADLHVLAESARSLSYAAASAASAGARDLTLRAAAAKAYCSQVLEQIAAQMIQLHGATGITWEHEAHRYFKRAHSSAQLFGQPSEHVARIAAALIPPP